MNSSTSPMLSKSRILAGLKCHLRLWNQCYEPERGSAVSPARQAIFDTGNEVGKFARHLYPGGILVEAGRRDHEAAARKTAALMTDPNVPAIYESAFVFNNICIRADILERVDDNTWNLIEVKSSTSVKKIYHTDIAVQYFVLQGCGVKINTAGILHLNNRYIYDGHQFDRNSLFTFSDITDSAINMQDQIAQTVTTLNQMLAENRPPDIKPARSCKRPYLCEFWDDCTRNMPQFWVVNLNGMSQERLSELNELGIVNIEDVPDHFSMNRLQNRIRTSVIQRGEYIAPELETELRDVSYPVRFLDFETMGSAIPRYAGTKPYQALPFQWSNHILREDGTLQHHEYLCLDDKDPREEFTDTLLKSLGNDGSIFIYTNYEKEIISHLAEHLPDKRTQLLQTLVRFKDLCEIIRKYYYHPHFYGSFSLKCVLPALVPPMSYDNLTIRDGNQASLEYAHMIDPSTSPADKGSIRANLLKYCGRDTMALVKIREELLNRFSDQRQS
jgi:predicted RecB family nuclease